MNKDEERRTTREPELNSEVWSGLENCWGALEAALLSFL